MAKMPPMWATKARGYMGRSGVRVHGRFRVVGSGVDGVHSRSWCSYSLATSKPSIYLRLNFTCPSRSNRPGLGFTVQELEV